MKRLQICLDKTGQSSYIEPSQVFSASCSLNPPKSKPDPAIYLHALEVLQLKTDEVIVVEDSVAGAEAAVGALIKYCAGCTATVPKEKKKERAEALLKAGCFVVVDDLMTILSLLK
jgi:beta-phosphoglucomutase-like phosphatase (HAD superfamily)